MSSFDLIKPAYKVKPNGGVHVFARLDKVLGIDERNWHHLDVQAMAPAEQDLVDVLRLGLGTEKHDV